MADFPLPQPLNDGDDQRNAYILPRSDYSISPLDRGSNEAANVIRQKLNRLYANEPDPFEEEREAEVVSPRSKHQQFMYDLNHSGKDLAQVQTEWHNYYLSLPDDEKHAVWQEFYASNQLLQQAKPNPISPTEHIVETRNQLVGHGQATKPTAPPPVDNRSVPEVQQAIRAKAVKPPLSKAQQQLHSLLFGLAAGAIAVIIFLFGFFNEVVIAPFIQPARTSAATPLIVTGDSVAPSSTPQVIIPKINVQIPVDFNLTTTDESVIENQLESGIVHYPTTSLPGQNGNSAFFGHSSNNIFNKGKYKFAFVLLHELVPGDTFYVTKDSKVYAYKVFSKTIVDPSEVGVLNPVTGHAATATLITCDPPGTSLRRLVVVGDQISPDISSNSAATTSLASQGTAKLAGNGQTLWGHFIGSWVGKSLVAVAILGLIAWTVRKTYRIR